MDDVFFIHHPSLVVVDGYSVIHPTQLVEAGYQMQAQKIYAYELPDS